MGAQYDLGEHRTLVLSAREACAHARTTIANAREAVARAHVVMRQARMTAAAAFAGRRTQLGVFQT